MWTAAKDLVSKRSEIESTYDKAEEHRWDARLSEQFVEVRNAVIQTQAQKVNFPNHNGNWCCDQERKVPRCKFFPATKLLAKRARVHEGLISSAAKAFRPTRWQIVPSRSGLTFVSQIWVAAEPRVFRQRPLFLERQLNQQEHQWARRDWVDSWKHEQRQLQAAPGLKQAHQVWDFPTAVQEASDANHWRTWLSTFAHEWWRGSRNDFRY